MWVLFQGKLAGSPVAASLPVPSTAWFGSTSFRVKVGERAYLQLIHAASAIKTAKPVRDELRDALALAQNSSPALPAVVANDLGAAADECVVSYPKGDLRRMLSVLGAIDSLPDPTLLKIAKRTGLDKKSVTYMITQAIEQAGVKISKTGPVYKLDDWGSIIQRTGAKMVLEGS
ncbi:hypothetical protein ACXM5X_30425 [Pseudomonas saponiphila]